MAEALWFQGAGVGYSADEDRRLIGAIWNAGIITGGVVSAGTGLAASVSAGLYVVSDGTGGAYLCYFDVATTVSGLTASTPNTLYVTISTTTGQATIVRAATAPAGPNLRIGTATTNATGVTGVTQGAAATFRQQTLTATSLSISGLLTVNSAGVNAPKGVRLGGANPTARAYSKAYRATDQSIPTGTTSADWQAVQYDAAVRDVNDYGTAPVHTSTGRFTAPVAGTYHCTGRATFNAAATNVGLRQSRIAVFSSTDTLLQSVLCDLKDSTGTGGNRVSWDCIVDMPVGAYVQFQVSHGQGTSLALAGEANPALIGANFASIRLIQAD
jgi:hypothetical protein